MRLSVLIFGCLFLCLPSLAGAHQERVTETTLARPICWSVLLSWRTGNLKQLRAVSNKGNRKMLARLKPGSSRYKSIFGKNSWRMKALRLWKNKGKHKVRQVGKRAYCRFLWRKQKREPMIVLHKEGRFWRFEDMNNVSVKTYRKGSLLH